MSPIRLARNDNVLANDSKTTPECRAYQAGSAVANLRKSRSVDRQINSASTSQNELRDRNPFGYSVISMPPKIVAIVDDDPGMRMATANLLSAFGYGTETFDSAEAFLNAAATSEASCLVVDIQLGDISGVELARQLAAESFKYPIIFMTALDDERIRSQAEAVGALAYLGKPFPPNLLLEAIAKAIG
jgi:CheY-like chemotaxis protein